MGDSPRETTELQWCFLLFCCWQWPPRLPLRQMPRLRLTLTFSTEDTTARGLLMPTPLLLPLLSATPTLFPTLPLPWSLPPSPSPTRPTPPPSRPTLLPPTLLSRSLSEATRPLPVTTVT